MHAVLKRSGVEGLHISQQKILISTAATKSPQNVFMLAA